MTRFHDPNAEVQATLHVLTYGMLPQDVVAEYFDAESRKFDWEGMLDDRAWSSGEKAFIRAAADIWGGTGTIGALIAYADDGPYRRVIEALALRRGLLLGET